MCLFPTPNTNYDGLAFKSGVTEFECGACPECLQKRSGRWALRCFYEARAHVNNCMITLTYDTFVRDENGNIVKDARGVPIENPVNPDLKVSKRDVQLFIKRLRKNGIKAGYVDASNKYFIGAEYGSRTHRAHYHAILFGVGFKDLVYYKKSKRGNPIFQSATLTKLWGHGICTVDSVSISSSISRYCSKYCAKSRSSETFNLFSQCIGLSGLISDFNGLSYYVDGREYPIPRVVWEHVIVSRYSGITPFPFSPKYVNRDYDLGLFDFAFKKSQILRENYRLVRNGDCQYQSYLLYWKHKSEQFSALKPSVYSRILSLPESRYHFYKAAALRCLELRKYSFCMSPGSRSGFGYYVRNSYCHLPWASRPNTASDTSVESFFDPLFDIIVSYSEKTFESPVRSTRISCIGSFGYVLYSERMCDKSFSGVTKSDVRYARAALLSLEPVHSFEFPIFYEQISFFS